MKKLSLIFCVLWVGVIFYLGTENSNMSHARSLSIVRAAKAHYGTVIERIVPENVSIPYKLSSSAKTVGKLTRDNILNFYIRKMGHFTEYLILAAVVCCALFSINLKGRVGLGYILFICLFCGVLDEFNQSLSSRTSLVSDVLIDFSGCLLGTGLYYFVYYTIQRLHSSKLGMKYSSKDPRRI